VLAWALVAAVLVMIGASSVLLASTADVRYERDVMRMAFNDNLEVLEDVRRNAGLAKDTLDELNQTLVTPRTKPYVV
jgi:hypothetical protein